MPLAVHALDVSDVIILMAFLCRIGLFLRGCELCVGKLPVCQIIIMELFNTFAGTWQSNNPWATGHRRAALSYKTDMRGYQNP